MSSIKVGVKRLCVCMLAAGLVGGCAELERRLPGGLAGTIGSVQSVGTAVANKPSLSDADEEKMAQANAKTFEAKNHMWEDPLLDAYLSEIMQRLVAVAHPRPFTYTVRVVNDGSINAFTFGGGILYVHAGLLARMDNEAEFAMVLGHEIAHVTERHIPKGIEATYGMQLIGQLGAMGAAAAGHPMQGEVLQKTYDYSMKASVTGHGRAAESEADVVGLEYMFKAGYDPRESPKTFQLLQKEYGDQGRVENFFYGSHPTNQSRIENLDGLLKSKYEKDIADKKLLVNTAEFRQRTRALVVGAAQSDYRGKRYNEAKALFERALQSKPDDAVSHYYLGKIALDTGGAGGADVAIDHLQAALKVNDKYIEPYRDLGLAYYRKKDSKHAIEAFEHYLLLSPNAKDAEPIKNYIDEMKRI